MMSTFNNFHWYYLMSGIDDHIVLVFQRHYREVSEQAEGASVDLIDVARKAFSDISTRPEYLRFGLKRRLEELVLEMQTIILGGIATRCCRIIFNDPNLLKPSPEILKIIISFKDEEISEEEAKEQLLDALSDEIRLLEIFKGLNLCEPDVDE